MNGEREEMRRKQLWSRIGGLLFFIWSLFLLISHQEIWVQTHATEEKTPLTYIALGDSLTAGLGASEVNYLRMNAFVPQLTKQLRLHREIYVENHGIPGITSSQLQIYLQQGAGVQEKLKEADLITLTIGGNDLLRLVRTNNLQAEIIQSTIQQYGQELQGIFQTIRQQNKTVPIYVMDLYSPYEAGHPLHEIGQATISIYNKELAKQVSAFSNIHIVSVYSDFLGKGNTLTHIAKNDIHPNDSGYRVIHQAFAKALHLDQELK